MATPTISAANLTRINSCDSLTNWSSIGGGPGAGLNNDVVVQGTGSIGRRIDSNVRGFALDLGVGNELDFSPGGANQGDHIWFWVNILQPSLINNMWLRLSEDAAVPNPGNSLDYEIFPANPYAGGWLRVCIDPRVPASVLNGVPGGNIDGNLNAIRWLAFIFDMGNVGGTSQNCLIDAIDVGRGLIVTGGTSGDRISWDDINTVASSNTNGYGMIEKRSGVFFMRGEWQLGDATNDCYFEDQDQTVVWENTYTVNRISPTPNVISAQAPDLNKLILVEGTGTTDFINGLKSGTGNDATGTNGCAYQTAPLFASLAVTNLTIDMSDADITNVELFGCRFRGVTSAGEIDTSITFCSDATNGPNHEVSGCTFDQCGLVDPGRVSMQNNLFSNTTQADAGIPFVEVHWEDNSASSFTDITSDCIDRNSSVNMYDLSTTNTNDAIYFGSRMPFEALEEQGDVWADSVSAPSWQYWAGIGWSSMPTITRLFLEDNATATNGAAGTNSQGAARHSWDSSSMSGWSQTTVNGGEPLYFIRIRNTGNLATGSGNARMNYCYTVNYNNGAAMLWNDNIDIANCSFVANSTLSPEVSHGIEHRTTEAATYTGLTFSGNNFDVLLTESKTELLDYNGSGVDFNVGDGTTSAVGQSFAGAAGTLREASVFVRKVGSPTGNATLNVYAHSGTFGSSGVPTGAALATSEPIDVSTLSTGYGTISRDFLDGTSLLAATNYVIVLEYDGGDGSNHLEVRGDSTSPTDPGNKSALTGSWAASAGSDISFGVWIGALVITSLSGSDPSTETTIGDSDVIFVNNSTVTLSGLNANTEVRVYTQAGGISDVELAGVENSTTSFAFIASAAEVVNIVINHLNYLPADIFTFTIPSNDVTIPISQFPDRSYGNPA